MNRYLRVPFYALLIMSLGVGITGCSKENERQDPPAEFGEDVGVSGQEDAKVETDLGIPPPPRPDVGPGIDADDLSDTDTEADIVEIAEAPPQTGHQLCAVAGRSSNGEVTALHCLGTHDSSGFRAKNDQGIWMPGTLQIIAE